MRIINLALALCLIFAASVNAEDFTERVGFGASAGSSVIVGNSDLRKSTDADFNWGVWARTGLTPNWGLGFSYDRIPFRRSDLKLEPQTLILFYQPAPESEYNPNVHIGAGSVKVGPSNGGGVWGFNGGIGADRFISNHISAGLSLDYRLINERSQAIRSDIHVVSASVKIGFWPSVKHKVKEEIKPAAQEEAAPKQEEIKPEEAQKPEVEPMTEVKLSEQPAQVEETEQAAQESPAAEPCIKETHFTAAHYAFNVSKLNAADKAAIREQARQIKADGYKKIIITGHTDNIGTYVANRHVSKARAQLVAAEFRKAGIKDIEVRWVDYSQPVASNSTKEGRAQNRRTEVDIEK